MAAAARARRPGRSAQAAPATATTATRRHNGGPPLDDVPPLDFDLHQKQSEAFQSPATELLYGGAAGGGKSHLFRVLAIILARLVPGVQIYLFRREFGDLYKNHMEGPSAFPAMLAPWINRKLVKINNSDHLIRFWNGSTIFLCHCHKPSDVLGFQGAEIHVLMIDELTHFLEPMYRYLRGRLRLGALKIPADVKAAFPWMEFPKIVVGANPGGVGHTWVKQTWIDEAIPFQLRRMPKKDGGLLRQYVPARLEDNPTLTENDPDYDARLEGLGNAALVKAMREGDWNIVAGGMFDDVWSDEKHFVPPFTIPSSWRIDRAFDWGSSKPFSVGWWAESDGTEAKADNGQKVWFPKGTLIRIAEWYGWNGTADDGCRMVASEIARGIRKIEESPHLRGRVKPGPADSQIFDTVNGNNIASDMARERVTWEPADKRPGSRINGWQLMRKRFYATLTGDRETAGLLSFNTCLHFKRTVPMLPRDQTKAEDVDSKSEDHVGDETRYRVLQTVREMRTLEFPI